jgi:prophage antirepressor-like protein
MIEEIRTDNNCIVKAFENNPIAILQEDINSKKVYYFKANDIGKVLNLTNIAVSIQNYDEDERVIRKAYDTTHREQDTTFLTSQGVYRLLYNSKKEIAKKFRKWAGSILDDIIFNESIELKKQLEEKETQMKLLQTENTKLKKKKAEKFLKKEALYIASDNPDRCVIGISLNLKCRVETYVLHNPDLKVMSVYYCRDYKLIESIIKKIMSKYVYHDRSNEWFRCSPEKIKDIVEVVIHLLDNDYNDFDDLQLTFQGLHKFLNIDKESIQTTAINTFFGESVYKEFIAKRCEIAESNKESAKNILLAFKDYIQETSEFNYYTEEHKNNNSYGFNQAFQKEFYTNICSLLNVELIEFRINNSTISGFNTLKVKGKEDLNTTELKNDFSETVYQDFLNNWMGYTKNDDKRGQLKIKTSDIVTHFTKYLTANKMRYKPTLVNDNVFRTKLVKLICNKFETKEHARLSFNGDVNRNRNKGFYGMTLR